MFQLEWLMEDEHTKSQADTGEGLDTDGSLYKALISNSTIQLGLHETVCPIG